MPTTPELYELAQRAIQDYYRDRSVPLVEIKDGLVGLHNEIGTLIDAIDTAEKEEPK